MPTKGSSETRRVLWERVHILGVWVASSLINLVYLVLWAAFTVATDYAINWLNLKTSAINNLVLTSFQYLAAAALLYPVVLVLTSIS